MNDERCLTCCFGDKCRSSCDCDDYSPTGNLDTENVDDMIKARHYEFLDEWYQYIEEYD